MRTQTRESTGRIAAAPHRADATPGGLEPRGGLEALVGRVRGKDVIRSIGAEPTRALASPRPSHAPIGRRPAQPSRVGLRSLAGAPPTFGQGPPLRPSGASALGEDAPHDIKLF